MQHVPLCGLANFPENSCEVIMKYFCSIHIISVTRIGNFKRTHDVDLLLFVLYLVYYLTSPRIVIVHWLLVFNALRCPSQNAHQMKRNAMKRKRERKKQHIHSPNDGDTSLSVFDRGGTYTHSMHSLLMHSHLSIISSHSVKPIK